jgi:hypothetical protein
MVQRKNLDITEYCIRNLSLEAIERGFKSVKAYMEHILEDAGKKAAKKKQK